MRRTACRRSVHAASTIRTIPVILSRRSESVPGTTSIGVSAWHYFDRNRCLALIPIGLHRNCVRVSVIATRERERGVRQQAAEGFGVHRRAEVVALAFVAALGAQVGILLL